MTLFLTVLQLKKAFPFLCGLIFFFMYFSFWYYIYNDKASIQLTVIGEFNPLLKIEEKNSTEWTEARAFVGNRPRGSTVSQRNS